MILSKWNYLSCDYCYLKCLICWTLLKLLIDWWHARGYYKNIMVSRFYVPVERLSIKTENPCNLDLGVQMRSGMSCYPSLCKTWTIEPEFYVDNLLQVIIFTWFYVCPLSQIMLYVVCSIRPKKSVFLVYMIQKA